VEAPTQLKRWSKKKRRKKKLKPLPVEAVSSVTMVAAAVIIKHGT
jgi:hypothetical protein